MLADLRSDRHPAPSIGDVRNVLIDSVVGVKVTAREAAQRLGVSKMQISRLIDAGEISADRFGNSWQVDLDSVHRYDDLRPKVGRPFDPSQAWSQLQSASAPTSVDAVKAIAIRVRRRAERCPSFVVPGELAGFLADDLVVCSGVSAAAEHGAAVQNRPPFAVYVRTSDLESVAREYAVNVGADDPNVIIRVVANDVWPFEKRQRFASPLIALVDLVDDRDDRSAREMLAVQ